MAGVRNCVQTDVYLLAVRNEAGWVGAAVRAGDSPDVVDDQHAQLVRCNYAIAVSVVGGKSESCRRHRLQREIQAFEDFVVGWVFHVVLTAGVIERSVSARAGAGPIKPAV